MTQEIIGMARQAGLCDREGRDDNSIIITDHLERFAKLIAAKEREACAKVADGWPDYDVQGLAEAIRARGNT
jgi:hypothetical protein